MVCPEGSLLDIIFINQNLMIALQEIEFGEPVHTTQFVKELINCRNGKTVFDGYHIECVIINTNCQVLSRFLTRRTREENGLVLGLMTPHCNMVSTWFSISFFLEMRIPIRMNIDRFSCGKEMNIVVSWSRWR